jgi:hypothetical protein
MKAKNFFYFLKHHYATIISLSVLTFIIIFFSCNSDNPNLPNTSIKKKYSNRDSPGGPCCNEQNPYYSSCEGNPIWSLKCGEYSLPCDSSTVIYISCECCKEYWDRYGLGGWVPCTVPCPDHIWPRLHCLETTDGGEWQ